MSFQSRFKILSFLLIVIAIISCSNVCNAELNINNKTDLELWSLWATKYDSNKLLLVGSSTAVVENGTNNKVSLYFGINASDSGNFNFIADKEVLLYGNIYFLADLKRNSYFSLGFKPGKNEKNAINSNRQYISGLPLIGIFKNYNDLKIPQIVFDGSYMQYNNALSLSYTKYNAYNTSYFDFTYIPNLELNLSKNHSFYKRLQHRLGAVEGSINYYNEYNDIGYGLISAVRLYTTNGIVPKGGEFFLSPNIDYWGFGLSCNVLVGFINSHPKTFSYQLTEAQLSYNIMKLTFSIIGGYHNINAQDDNYRANMDPYVTFNAMFGINHNLVFKSAIYYHKIARYKTNQGVALGFNIKL